MRDSLTIKAAPSSANDLEMARETLVNFFELLHDESYNQAAKLYEGAYKELRERSPNISPAEYGGLFEAACENRGYACLDIDRVVRSDTVAAGEFVFDVEFQEEDGDTFQYDRKTRWTYTVLKVNGAFLVQNLPVYQD